jgi:uncharacterized surface protein with fasciclin (FAS1) repeats
MMKNIKKWILASLVGCAAVVGFTACSDEPDSEYFYTFNGEMMSEYLRNRPQYSNFTKIVERARLNSNQKRDAKLMDMLATYGHYTCFVPSDSAVQTYLAKRGLSSVDQLTDEDCDTIALTHIVANIYNTMDMTQDRLQTANLLGRYLATSADEADGHPVVRLEDKAYIYYELQNDSVENGIMQPINMVIEKSNSYVTDIIGDNERIKIFYTAMKATGVFDDLESTPEFDPDWDPKAHPRYYYRSHVWSEVAWVPDTKKNGFTIFIEPDSVYQAKFEEMGISTSEGNLRAVYDLACKIYDETYPEDVNKPGHAFDQLKDSVNPLRRFVQYHILNRYVPGTSDLTPLIMDVGNGIRESFGIDSRVINPCDWFQTLLPRTMVKIEQLTVDKDNKGNDCRGADAPYVRERFVNRRYAAPEYKFRGSLIDSKVETEPVHDALNGHYFYVDDLVVFSKQVRDEVQNQRIRMDFSAIFPEVMTNDMRLKGNPLADDAQGTPDESAVPKNGRNFYFPLGYLDGVDFNSTCYLVMRRPHCNFWSWQGDEWNLFGDYDMTFRIPPVPYSGEWQLRLGFCAIPTRGVMQVYFDGVPQGIPLDMTKELNSEMYLGDRFVSDEALSNYKKMTVEERAEEQKLLKNLHAYRAGISTYHFGANSGNRAYFYGDNGTYRRVLCQAYLDANVDHYIRFRVASDGKKGNNNEFMLDYFEMVPKSVYGIDGDAEMEDDL